MRISETEAKSILTRSTGYLREVCSHSLQPYRGCSFGRALCGVGCYVQHNPWLTRGEAWGSFLEARVNAAQLYIQQHEKEAAWARRQRGRFSIFMSSSTDPFLPHEDRFGITKTVLEAMLERPPDCLILHSHSHRVGMYSDLCVELARRCELRVHISIESDRDRLPGLPAPASSVEMRLQTAAALRTQGIRVVVTAAPLMPIADPEGFFARVSEAADALVLDHFIGGDGSKDGNRTARTALPDAMSKLDPTSVELAYRDLMHEVASRFMPGRVGLGMLGFAGQYS
jgi:DNA repair photolyase